MLSRRILTAGGIAIGSLVLSLSGMAGVSASRTIVTGAHSGGSCFKMSRAVRGQRAVKKVKNVPTRCPPRSVYRQWNHVTYSGNLASKQAPRASWNCTVYAGDPTWSDKGYVVSGEGAQFCSGVGWAKQRVRVALETYEGLGVWQIRVRDGTAFSNADSSDYTVYWDCAGSGTQTYRTVVDGYAQSGGASQSVQSENDPRLTCNS